MKMTELILGCGVKSITVHPRPDERHIRRQDVYELSQLLSNKPSIEFNIEGYPSDSFLQLIAEIQPTQATLVPDPPDVLTSNAGWALEQNKQQLQAICSDLRNMGIRSSLFVDPFTFNEQEAAALDFIRPDRIELYTEAYAQAFGGPDQQKVVAAYQAVAQSVDKMGLGVNAGHDLDQTNLGHLLTAIPEIVEVSIGHALICEALLVGLEPTVKAYLEITGS